MCGIVGVLSQNRKADQVLLKRMAGAIAHRGPDGDGFWLNSERSVGFGHRRLAIIDLSDAGKQPMFYANDRYVLTFNGEIYNYIELRQQLESRGYTFVSTSDTEVLLALFAEKKEKCLQDLDGMFSFAIWDEQEHRMFVARDRFGEKPFYYAIHDGNFYFASEMKALWAAGVPRDVSSGMLYNYLTGNFMYNPGDLSETFYNGIHKLKAAHYAYISPAKLQADQTRYWEIDYKNIDRVISEDDAIDKFRQLFNESVKRRLRSDVPVGSSLSGGLDSSLIVCTIDGLNSEKNLRQATFSARFPGFAKDEGQYMQAVIDHTNVEPHFIYPDDDGLIDNLEKVFHHQEEPFGSASIYAQYCVMQAAKDNNVTVLLDGQGADELLGGYHSYFDDYLRGLKASDKKLWRSEGSAYGTLYGSSSDGFEVKKALKRFMPETFKNKARRIRHALQKHNSFLNDDFQHQNASASFSYLDRADSLSESLFRHSFGGPLEELLRYADRNSMAHSREVRLPFLNHELAEFLFSLQPTLKIRNGTFKYIMREAFRDVLPAVIVDRTDKIGYEPPQKTWLANPRLVEKTESSANSLAAAGILNSKSLAHIQANEEEASIFNSYRWKVLMAGYLFES